MENEGKVKLFGTYITRNYMKHMNLAGWLRLQMFYKPENRHDILDEFILQFNLKRSSSKRNLGTRDDKVQD